MMTERGTRLSALLRPCRASAAGTRRTGCAQALIVLLWRAGLRISEALALAESDLDRTIGGALIQRCVGGKRRQVGMDHRWGWQQIERWLDQRRHANLGSRRSSTTARSSTPLRVRHRRSRERR